MVKSKDRRQTVRKRMRVTVEYGENDLERKGFSKDISIGGIFLISNKLFQPTTRLHLHVAVPKGDFYAEGEVVHVKKVPIQLQRMEQPGFGIRFMNSAEVVRAIVPTTHRRVETLGLVCQSKEQLEKILSEQLVGGVLVVPVEDPVPCVNSMVEFQIRLEFSNRNESIEGSGRIVQILGSSESGGANAVLEVKDAAALVDDLKKIAWG